MCSSNLALSNLGHFEELSEDGKSIKRLKSVKLKRQLTKEINRSAKTQKEYRATGRKKAISPWYRTRTGKRVPLNTGSYSCLKTETSLR